MLTSEEVMQLQDELQLKLEDEWLRLLYRLEAAAGCDWGMWHTCHPCPHWRQSASMLATLPGVLVAYSELKCECSPCGGQLSKQLLRLLQCKVQQA